MKFDLNSTQLWEIDCNLQKFKFPPCSPNPQGGFQTNGQIFNKWSIVYIGMDWHCQKYLFHIEKNNWKVMLFLDRRILT